jgi:hypothetical protein
MDIRFRRNNTYSLSFRRIGKFISKFIKRDTESQLRVGILHLSLGSDSKSDITVIPPLTKWATRF